MSFKVILLDYISYFLRLDFIRLFNLRLGSWIEGEILLSSELYLSREGGRETESSWDRERERESGPCVSLFNLFLTIGHLVCYTRPPQLLPFSVAIITGNHLVKGPYYHFVTWALTYITNFQICKAFLKNLFIYFLNKWLQGQEKAHVGCWL